MPTAVAAVSYEPIQAVRSLAGQGNSPSMGRFDEVSALTVKIGTPVKLDNNGFVAECTFVGADIVLGITAEAGHNLTTSGTAQDLNDGVVQNQASAVVTPVGARMRDGKMGLYRADARTVFSIALKATQVFTRTMIGTVYGIVKDATTGFWYLDNTVTGAGNNVVFQVMDVDPSCPNTATDGSRVFGQIVAAKRVFQ